MYPDLHGGKVGLVFGLGLGTALFHQLRVVVHFHPRFELLGFRV